MISLIRRDISYIDGLRFTKLFTIFVRFHFKYGQVIWVQRLKKQIIILEKLRPTEHVDRSKTWSIQKD